MAGRATGEWMSGARAQRPSRLLWASPMNWTVTTSSLAFATR